MKTLQATPSHAFTTIVWRIFGDSYIAMLAVGGLAHKLPALKTIDHIGYWGYVLALIAIQALWGTDHGFYTIKEAGGSN